MGFYFLQSGHYFDVKLHYCHEFRFDDAHAKEFCTLQQRSHRVLVAIEECT